MWNMSRFFPVFQWMGGYDRQMLRGDLLAAVIVTIMLIPQSLAYALLAGLPPETGLYASIFPIVLYAIFGTSHSLAVGPVAVISLMTAAAIGELGDQGIDYVTAALTLAFLSGIFLLLLGVLRLGFLANFLSHPVISGFITASGILIAASQLKHIFGIDASGDTLPELAHGLWVSLGQVNWITTALGASTVVFLFWARSGLKQLLRHFGFGPTAADMGAKAGPVVAVFLTTFAVWAFDLSERGVDIVGAVPQKLPPLTVPSFDPSVLTTMIGPAILLSIIGFVESISVAQTLAAKRRQRINPDQELIGLGAANIGASFSGGFPVTGGFSRSVVNFDAGAQTPAAGVFTAAGLAFAAVALTPLVYFLPNTTLAATIIVAVLSLIDISIIQRAWRYSRTDLAAVVATILLTLGFGVEIGVSAGVLISVLIHLYSSSRPHMAIVGQIPSTEHYRNIDRHKVIIYDEILSVRIDESLYFANARNLEDRIYAMVAGRDAPRHVILMCSAVNDVDMSALESLEAINSRLADRDIKFHLSEVKGPVMDCLKKTTFVEDLTGQIFLTHDRAVRTLRASNPVPGNPSNDGVSL